MSVHIEDVEDNLVKLTDDDQSWKPGELERPVSFGILSHYGSGEYEVFIETELGAMRYLFGFDELLELARMAVALPTYPQHVVVELKDDD